MQVVAKHLNNNRMTLVGSVLQLEMVAEWMLSKADYLFILLSYYCDTFLSRCIAGPETFSTLLKIS